MVDKDSYQILDILSHLIAVHLRLKETLSIYNMYHERIQRWGEGVQTPALKITMVVGLIESLVRTPFRRGSVLHLKGGPYGPL